MANKMRLIDADALLEYVERQTRQIPAKEYDNDGFYHYSGWNGACVMARCAIKNAPTVDAAPVVQGRWDMATDGDGVVCSVCGTDFCILLNETDGFKYCPNCGAKMDGDQDV